MFATLIAFFVLFVILYFIIFWQINVRRIRNKLNWLPLASGYPIIGSALHFRNSILYLKKLSEFSNEFNGMFTINIINRTYVVGIKHKFLEFIFTSTNELNNKSLDYVFFNRWLGTGLLTSSDQKWKNRRKILTPAFHFSILEQFVDTIDSVTNILIEKWKKEIGNPCFDIYPYINLCSLDIICESTMGVSVNAQKDENSDYVKSVKEMCRIIVDRIFSPYKSIESLYCLTPDYQKELKALKVLHSFSNNVINNRINEFRLKSKNKEPNSDDDIGRRKKLAFLDLLLAANLEVNELSREDIREEVDTFMFEGHDTTTSGISFTLYCLSRNPKIQDKVYEELKEIMGDDLNRPITFDDLQKMKYLEKCIKEGLRLYPSVPFIGRAVEKDTFFEGNLIPKGVVAAVYIFDINRNPRYFENPECYIPDRFDNLTGKHPYSYIPFSAGPRNCIGQKFAMLELKTVIAKILLNYELLPSTPDVELCLSAEIILKSSTGINCSIKRRR